LEDDWNAHAGRTLDFVIAIVEGLAEPAGKQSSDRGFSGAHEAHEKDVAGGIIGARGRALPFHPAILSESPPANAPPVRRWGKGGNGGKPWKVSLCSLSAETRALRRAALPTDR